MAVVGHNSIVEILWPTATAQQGQPRMHFNILIKSEYANSAAGGRHRTNGILTIHTHAGNKNRQNKIKSCTAAIEICMLDLMVADKLWATDPDSCGAFVYSKCVLLQIQCRPDTGVSNNTICINGHWRWTRMNGQHGEVGSAGPVSLVCKKGHSRPLPLVYGNIIGLAFISRIYGYFQTIVVN